MSSDRHIGVLTLAVFAALCLFAASTWARNVDLLMGLCTERASRP